MTTTMVYDDCPDFFRDFVQVFQKLIRAEGVKTLKIRLTNPKSIAAEPQWAGFKKAKNIRTFFHKFFRITECHG